MLLSKFTTAPPKLPKNETITLAKPPPDYKESFEETVCTDVSVEMIAIIQNNEPCHIKKKSVCVR